MDIETYGRKTFEVQAVQITEENFHDVAQWTGTCITIDWNKYGEREHILLKTTGDSYSRHMRVAAFVGDWVTLTDGKFNRVPDKKFRVIFERRTVNRYKLFEEILKLVETRDAGVPAGDIAQQILNLS